MSFADRSFDSDGNCVCDSIFSIYQKKQKRETQGHFWPTITIELTPHVTFHFHHVRTLIFDLLLPPAWSGRSKVLFPALACTGKPLYMFSGHDHQSLRSFCYCHPIPGHRESFRCISHCHCWCFFFHCLCSSGGCSYCDWLCVFELISIFFRKVCTKNFPMMKAVLWGTCLLQMGCLEKGAHVPAGPWCCRAFLVCKGWLQQPVTTGSGNSGNHLFRQPFRIPSIPHHPNVGVQVERQGLPKIIMWHRSVLIPAY